MARNEAAALRQQQDATTPCTLLEAIRRCLRNDDARYNSQPPVDLVAVVVNASYSPAIVWLGDDSLSHEQPSCIVAYYFGLHRAEQIRQEQIGAGDMLRLNRVVLRGKASSRKQPSREKAETTVYQFQHNNWTDPEAGPEYCRLGRLEAGTFQPTTQDIPASMLTNAACIQRLATWWFQQRHQGQQTTRFTPPPCQYQSLAQLVTSMGVRSHVVAKVQQIVDCSSKDYYTTSYLKRESKRSRHLKQQNRPLCYALLTDTRHTLLPFLVMEKPQGRFFRSVFQQALREDRPVRLMHVQTQQNSSHLRYRRNPHRPFMEGDNEVVLVASSKNNCTVEIVQDSHNYWQYAPAPSLSCTPQTEQSAALATANPGRTRTVLSPMSDILVRSTSLASSQLVTDEDLRSAMRCTHCHNSLQDYSYCSATILLANEDQRSFFADGSIVSVLCGDVALSDKEWTPRLLLGLLEERIPLQWTIRDDQNIVHVSLLSVPLDKLRTTST